jgi:hypothetical protein
VVATNGDQREVSAPAPVVGEAHTAPHDEIIGIARDLIDRSGSGAVSIDALANALKSRGFRRTPGSPRLITRLRRIREIEISRSGLITLVNGVRLEEDVEASFTPGEEVAAEALPAGTATVVEAEPAETAERSDVIEGELIEAEGDDIGNRKEESAPGAEPRRRARRGGRRRRGPRRAAEPAAT